jgi:protein tyrosine/serine phosphatase
MFTFAHFRRFEGGKRVSRATWPLFFIALQFVSFSIGLARTENPELPRFFKVNESLYRGAQPKAGGMARLASLGVRTVICLRQENEDTRIEAEEARKSGILFVSIPLPELSRPADDKVAQILKLINESKNGAVFVHCNHGRDRTGTIVACYRIEHDGWSSKQAKDEAHHFGLSRFEFGMSDFISDFAKKKSLKQS